jgi:hypothetical protein
MQSQEKVPLELLERDDLSLSEPYPDPDAARRRD